VWSGTSFAAPQIAALIAKKCLDESKSPHEAAEGRPKDGFGTRVFPLRGTRPAQSPQAD
jgi:hypothetical protein